MITDPCTSTGLRTLDSCLDCLSVSRLESLEIIAWNAANGNGLTFSVPSLQADAVGFKTFSKKQLMEAQLAKMLSKYLASSSVSDLIALSKCLDCMSPRQRAAILTRLQCVFWQAQSPLIL